MKKILAAMSGGVDSAVSVLLLQRQGYTVGGATMLLQACGMQEAEDARRSAQTLGIDFYCFQWQDAFRQFVIEPFKQVYMAGGTPNPCIFCNKTLKFGAFLDKALELGYDGMATGHYARIRQDDKTGRYLLYKAADRVKDQTYFLACLEQDQLAHIQFPLGELTKEEVRAIAREQSFVNARKRDSQDICFVPHGDYVAFMEAWTGKTYPQGDYLDLNGNVLGQHKGAVCYTIGQRKGLGIALGAPAYVCRKDMQANTVTLGPNDALFSKGLVADNWNWFPFPILTEPLSVTAKIRHSQHEQSATVYPGENGTAKVMFDDPQRAITPGQAVVLYDGDLVIGGGTIRKALW